MSSDSKILSMTKGGAALGTIRDQLRDFAQIGVTFEQIEAEAQRLIAAAGMKPSFSTVKGYDWATCIMLNEELCHGIPVDGVIQEGDVVTIDVGLIHNGYHLDTTTTFAAGEVPQDVQDFLERGRKILDASISRATVGNSVYGISYEMESGLKKYGYGVVRQLTGHGIGKELHMYPSIPCFAQRSDKRIILEEGQTLAIEVMYTMGSPLVVEADDGWTFVTEDDSLSAMFEETVLVTKDGPQILTS
ncbi:MAG: type I methionyl aminopeptidase [Microgenomates group bacterium]